ncbi:MAG: hypothetical protein GC191_05225 [Azospirillum sp.]|nr:hypothetical protein [Azospirillum sp.]
MTYRSIASGLLAVLTIGTAAAAEPVCQRAGAFIACNDGTTYYTVGNQTLDNRGHVWSHYGDVSLGPDGQVIRRLPGQGYVPDPQAWPPFGQGALAPPPPR